MKTLIKNGLIYDGTGDKPYEGDILIKDDRIVEIRPSDDVGNSNQLGYSGEGWSADFVFYADHKAVTPGFIDSHRHCDIAAVADPNFGEI